MKNTQKSDLLHALMPLTVEHEFSGDTQGYFFFQNDKNEAQVNSSTISEVQDLVKNKVFKAAAKSAFFIRGSYIEKENLLILGLGSKSDFTLEKARQTGAIAYTKLSAEKVSKFGINVDQLIKAASRSQAMGILSAFLEGFYLASYSFDKYKTKGANAGHKLDGVVLVSADRKLTSALETLAHEVLITADCIFTARDFSNEPSNIGTPERFAGEISAIAKKFGLKCKVLNEAEAKKEKMNLFLSVSAGSHREAQVVVLEYTPKAAKKAKTVGLVGKGVTFDSGGISIKPSLRMEDMKHDMSGASSILGATLLAARLGCKNKIITVLMFTENMPNGIATQPGNIVVSRAGKTVEIINTDAEGRLVLADALDYIQDRKPDVVVNAATLTGACSIALGKLCSALFSNDPKLTARIQSACGETQERLWELPMFDEYIDDMRGSYADMMNVGNDSYGGTIRGAVFLKQFIRKGQSWAHIDLANTAYDLGYLPYNPRKGASGSYVRTLARFTLDY